MAAFTNIFERFVAFRRIPMRVVLITGLTSYVLQLGAILQGQPLYIIALYTLIPWVPLFLFEGLWKYEHYSFIAVFAVITALQVGHLGEHGLQIGQLYGQNGVLACPFPQDTAANAQRAIDAGLRRPDQGATGIYASAIVHDTASGIPVFNADGSYNTGPPACGVFGQLDFETIHFVWDTLVWIGALVLLWRFPRNAWLWLAVFFASLHEMEHAFLFWIYITETSHAYAYTHTIYGTVVDRNTVTAIPLGKVTEPYTFYEAGGKAGLWAKNGMIESIFFGQQGRFPFRPLLHLGYNTLVVVPTVIGFFWQSRKVYNAFLAKALPTLTESELIAATAKLQRMTFDTGASIIRQGDVADHFYVISRGQVDIVRRTPEGREVVVTRLGAGQYFGEIGILHGGKRTADVRAVDDVEVMALDGQSFRELMAGSKSSEQALGEVMRQRIVQMGALQQGA